MSAAYATYQEATRTAWNVYVCAIKPARAARRYALATARGLSDAEEGLHA